eukprot:TRINITY_DN47906_c0_g1_i1.p1 TRINITY_DN47906_c0_g1~~TRINITY_DN47906_c0_g1_i1.p1  ORF type:complete len:210 (+),score=25.13 TRINITY_DN47906_c0_g1_i1:180-809(+)
MIRNIPVKVSQKMFIDYLVHKGFGESFDFFYLPCSFQSKESKGYAFINLTNQNAVYDFVCLFHSSRCFHTSPGHGSLNVSAAKVQGSVENLRKFDRSVRIRNRELRPFFKACLDSAPSSAFANSERMVTSFTQIKLDDLLGYSLSEANSTRFVDQQLTASSSFSSHTVFHPECSSAPQLVSTRKFETYHETSNWGASAFPEHSCEFVRF